jgi:hypothetical protein
MRTFDPATLAYLQAPSGKEVRVLAYVWARRRSDDVIEGMGLWNGEQDRVFSIRGSARTYFRAAGLMSMDEIIMTPGTDAAMTQFVLSPIDPAVKAMIGMYDLRFAPVELHRALFWPDTGALVAEPHRVLKGWIDGTPDETGEVGESAELTIRLSSANQILTRTLPFKKSDSALRAARSNDAFRQYTDVGSVITPWGEKRVGERSGGNAAPVLDLLRRAER